MLENQSQDYAHSRQGLYHRGTHQTINFFVIEEFTVALCFNPILLLLGFFAHPISKSAKEQQVSTDITNSSENQAVQTSLFNGLRYILVI